MAEPTGQSKGSFNDLHDYREERQQIARQCTEVGPWLWDPVGRPSRAVAYVDYIRGEHIGVHDRVEDSDFAVAVGGTVVVPGDHEDVES